MILKKKKVFDIEFYLFPEFMKLKYSILRCSQKQRCWKIWENFHVSCGCYVNFLQPDNNIFKVFKVDYPQLN